jgi:hypothetical protein
MRVIPMKRVPFLLIFVSLLASSCHMRNQIVGSGKRALQKRDVGTFTSISSEGAFEIRVTCQQAAALEIEADDNILPLISTEVSNGVLRLKPIESYSSGEPVTLKITVPNLEALNVSGAGKIDISGVKNDKLEIDASGAPSINVSGLTRIIDIETSGAAKIDTHKLRASRAVVNSKGVSNIDLDVSDQLDVTISGPSRVSYEGDPIVNKQINGPGKLEKKASTGA